MVKSSSSLVISISLNSPAAIWYYMYLLVEIGPEGGR
jgi:hypothetical protein